MELNKILSSLRTDGCDYHQYIEDIRVEKKAAQNKSDETAANNLWAYEELIEIHKSFVDMYGLLREAKYYEAWCEAERIEISIGFLARNNNEVFKAAKDLGETITRLQSLYPYKLFASYVMHVKRETCTICGKERSVRHFCGHRAGRVYDGELCLNKVVEADFKGVDVVQNPEHKYAVLFPTEDGEKNDEYDYTLVEGLMKFWSAPFQHWAYKVETIFKKKSEFPWLSDDSYCPCGSTKTYAECCKLNPEGIKNKLYTFLMEPLL